MKSFISKISDKAYGTSCAIASWLMLTKNAFAQANFDPTNVTVDQSNPFAPIGDTGSQLVEGFLTYVMPVVILAVVVWALMMYKFNKLDWPGLMKTAFVVIALIFVREFASWLFNIT